MKSVKMEQLIYKGSGIKYSEYMEKYGKPYYGTNEDAENEKKKNKEIKKA